MVIQVSSSLLCVAGAGNEKGAQEGVRAGILSLMLAHGGVGGHAVESC